MSENRQAQNANVQSQHQQQHNTILQQLLDNFTNEEAFTPLNIPDVVYFESRPTDVSDNLVGATFNLRTPCLHERKVYKSPDKVPIKVCEKCESVIVPETAHSVVARALPLPLSMQKDDRWPQLFEIFEQHREMLGEVDSLLEQQEHLLIRLYRWREAYSRDALIDFNGKNNPMFSVLENSLKRTGNATIGFQQTIEALLVDTRRTMLKQVNRCIPHTVDDFINTTKMQIISAHPTALYHPNASKNCTVCDTSKCNVVLYSTRPRTDQMASLRSFLFSRDNSSRNLPPPPSQESFRCCTCKELAICLDCLLKWYWESSEKLKKSFANCPLCRAEFHIEDILPIYEGPTLTNSTPRQQNQQPTNSGEMVEENSFLNELEDEDLGELVFELAVLIPEENEELQALEGLTREELEGLVSEEVGEDFYGCQRACKQCIPKSELCCHKSCPSAPVYKEFHQGVIMSGAGKPPHTEGGVDEPDPKCFLYATWYDFENNVLYKLSNDLKGKPVGYDAFNNGAELLKQYKITDPSNPGVLGAVLSSESIFSLQACINADAAASRPTGTRNALTNTARVLNCVIKNSNLGSIGFIYGNPPIPLILDQLQNNAGYTTTPDFWLVPGKLPDEEGLANGFWDFGWIVFVRDKRNSKYYRDTFNSPENDPNFPPNEENPNRPCDGDFFGGIEGEETFGLIYQFDATTCRWYLYDANEDVLAVLDDINQGLEPDAGTCLIDADWRKNCKCSCDTGSCCDCC